ncbi:MAG TPA: hypothetical protein VKE69_09215 [Planctomycetota bacterium]|nr:hypothetical protein [Planctomycetota bacterium]
MSEGASVSYCCMSLAWKWTVSPIWAVTVCGMVWPQGMEHTTRGKC